MPLRDVSSLEVMSQIGDRRLVFIGGLHRSGTTLLADCIGDHPDVSGFVGTSVPRDEGQFLQSVYPVARTYGGPGRFGFHREAWLTEESPLATSDNALKLWKEWSVFWDLKRSVLLEKSPPNLLHYRFLQRIFPGSFFVTIVRHPVAVSLSTRKWSKAPLDLLIEHWLTCHEVWQQDRLYLSNELAFKYEEFVASPQKVLDRIFAFIGIDTISIGRRLTRDSNVKYYKEWEKQRRSWRCRHRHERWLDRFAERVFSFGYSLDPCSNIADLPEKFR